MLQRPQTLILLGAFILNILLLTGPLASFSGEGNEWVLRHSGLFDQAGENSGLATWPLSTLVISLAVLSFGVIFSYMNRMRQMRLSIFLILLSAGLTGMMFYYIWAAGQELEGTHRLYAWRFVLPPVNLVLFYFAFRLIRKDELLVKAYDRLR